MAEMNVSSQRVLRAVLIGLIAATLAGCGTFDSMRRDAEVRKLQARATYEQALRNLADKRVGLGLQGLREAANLDPDNAVFRNALGVTLLELGQPGDAEAEFRKAVDLDSNYAEAFHNLGLSLAEQGRLEEAIPQYRKAISLPIYPTPEVGYYSLGTALLLTNKPKDAEEAFRASITLNPKLPGAHYNLGVALTAQGRKDEARQAFRRVQELEPTSTWGQLAGEALKRLGQGG